MSKNRKDKELCHLNCHGSHRSRWIGALIIIASACGIDQATSPNRPTLDTSHVAKVYAPDTQDTLCTESWTVSSECAESMESVLISGSSQPTKILFVSVLNIPPAPNWDLTMDPSWGPHYTYGRLVGPYGELARVTVEAACDPRLAGCLLPLQAQDIAFLNRIQTFFKALNDIADAQKRQQCSDMFNQLQWLIGLTLNRAPSDTIGIYRGSYDVSNGDLGIHGGATNAPGAPTLHLDGYVWDGIHQADSAQTQPRAVSTLLHEAAHTFGADHIPPPGVLLNYNNFDYFKHVIIDDPNSCVKQFYQ